MVLWIVLALLAGLVAGAGLLLVWQHRRNPADVETDDEEAAYMREVAVPLMLGVAASLMTAALLGAEFSPWIPGVLAMTAFVVALRWWGQFR